MSELLRLTVYVMLLSPLLGALVIAIMAKRIGSRGAESISVVMCGMSLLMAFLVVYQSGYLVDNFGYILIYRWIDYEPSRILMGLWVDHLTVATVFMVASISWFIQIYSIGYMQHDSGYPRYCALLNMFIGSMLILVMSGSMIMTFFAWESLSIVSYALIAYWYEKKNAVDAAFKAIIVNRFGDCFLLVGIILWRVWGGSWEVSDILMLTAESHIMEQWQYDLVAGCMMMGVVTKSAQIPFHIWLPSAMEGPTPVSALLHAATLVTAGIFWTVRYSQVFALSPLCGEIVMCVAATGSVLMALQACMEDNIKRVMAYSTLSQLGIMACATGAGAYSLALFHVFTHAYTKALLFLVVGKITLLLHHQLSLSAMGGLLMRMPFMATVMFFASMALVGIPPFSGFWSKEAIIHVLFAQDTMLSHYAAWMLIVSGGLSAAYMVLLWKKVFLGPVMTIPSVRAKNLLSFPILALIVPCLYLGKLAFYLMITPQFWLVASSDAMRLVLHKTGLIMRASMMHDSTAMLGMYSIFFGGFFAWYRDYIGYFMPRRLKKVYAHMRRSLMSVDACYAFLMRQFYVLSMAWVSMEVRASEGLQLWAGKTVRVLRSTYTVDGSFVSYALHSLSCICMAVGCVAVSQYFFGVM